MKSIVRMVKLPVEICDEKNALGVLAARQTTTDTFARLLLARDFAFNGEPPESFMQLCSVKWFAFHGKIAVDFLVSEPIRTQNKPAHLPGFHLAKDIQIQLEGVDLILPEVSDFGAVNGELLLFVRDEIMAIASAKMTARGLYSISALRGFYNSGLGDLRAGDEVFIIDSAQLPIARHSHFRAGSALRFKFAIGRRPASDCDVFSVNF